MVDIYVEGMGVEEVQNLIATGQLTGGNLEQARILSEKYTPEDPPIKCGSSNSPELHVPRVGRLIPATVRCIVLKKVDGEGLISVKVALYR